MNRTCKNCQFFTVTTGLSEFNERRPKGSPTNGECRRYAPKPFQAEETSYGSGYDFAGKYWVWPMVSSGWGCGEWAPE